MRRELVRCYLCGCPVESPQARDGKHEWLCCLCWARLEEERARRVCA